MTQKHFDPDITGGEPYACGVDPVHYTATTNTRQITCGNCLRTRAFKAALLVACKGCGVSSSHRPLNEKGICRLCP